MDRDGHQWIEMDCDGYIITHTGKLKMAMYYYGRDGQQWIEKDSSEYQLSHPMDKRREQWNTMNKDGQQWIATNIDEQ